MACGQRVENTQPTGGFSGDGSSPVSTIRCLRTPPKAGVDASSACVYGCSGRAKMRSFGPLLHREAQVHDQHLVRDVAHHRQVVGNEEVGDAQAALQIRHEIQHLRLHGDVERGHGLVGDHERGLEHQRAGDGDALALAAREHVRVAIVVLGP